VHGTELWVNTRRRPSGALVSRVETRLTRQEAGRQSAASPPATWVFVPMRSNAVITALLRTAQRSGANVTDGSPRAHRRSRIRLSTGGVDAVTHTRRCPDKLPTVCGRAHNAGTACLWTDPAPGIPGKVILRWRPASRAVRLGKHQVARTAADDPRRRSRRSARLGSLRRSAGSTPGHR
jgi:hypothetical protein